MDRVKKHKYGLSLKLEKSNHSNLISLPEQCHNVNQASCHIYNNYLTLPPQNSYKAHTFGGDANA
jgi:hypothetical protein